MLRGLTKFAIAAAGLAVAVSALATPLEDVKAGLDAAKRGNREEAIRFLTRAIEARGLSNENQAIALINRGYAFQRNGEHDNAVDDYQAAIRLMPKSPAGYRNRASSHLETGRYREAIEDFEKAKELSPRSAYLSLWLHAARAKALEDDTRELREDAASVDLAAWPGPILAVLAGRITRQAAEAAAAAAGDAGSRDTRRCDFAFHFGVHEMARGNREGLVLLREARDKCAPESVERAVARAEILRLSR